MIGQSDISYKTIRNVLNAHGGNVGSKHSDFFSEKAKINKWSKRKPVEHQKMFKLTDEDFASVNWGWAAESYANPFRLIDAWCGDFGRTLCRVVICAYRTLSAMIQTL